MFVIHYIPNGTRFVHILNFSKRRFAASARALFKRHFCCSLACFLDKFPSSGYSVNAFFLQKLKCSKQKTLAGNENIAPEPNISHKINLKVINLNNILQIWFSKKFKLIFA